MRPSKHSAGTAKGDDSSFNYGSWKVPKSKFGDDFPRRARP